MRRVLIVLLALFVLAGGGFAATGGPLADLRPDVITEAPQPEREAKGRALLDSAWRAAGGEQTLDHDTVSFTFEDTWVGVGTLFNPWPDDAQRARITQRVHSFDSRVELENGPAADTTWGITDGRGWTEQSGAATPSDDPDLLFMLPTVHYFVEMPQRFTEAPIARFVEERTIRGRTYDVVFVSWETPLAHDAHDQYLVHIDQETGRVGIVHYTVRAIGRFVTGVGHLLDQREVDGVWIPHRMPVTTAVDADPADHLHEMLLSDVRWDAEPVEVTRGP